MATVTHVPTAGNPAAGPAPAHPPPLAGFDEWFAARMSDGHGTDDYFAKLTPAKRAAEMERIRRQFVVQSHPAYRDAHRVNQLLHEAADAMKKYARKYRGDEVDKALYDAGFDPDDDRFSGASFLSGIRKDFAGLAYTVAVLANLFDAVSPEPIGTPAGAVGQKGGESS